MENKYENSKIYKLVDIGYNKCYIGSTIESLSVRIAKHRADYKRYQNEKMNWMSSFDLFSEFGIANCKIELVENYPCNSKEELRAREGFHIQVTECVNKRIPNQTLHEYYEKNKIYLSNKAKIYYVNNKEEVLARLEQPTKCECGCSVMLCNMRRHLKTDKHKKLIIKM